MHLIGSLENDGTGAYLLHFAVYQRFYGSFFDNDNFFFGMLVWRVRAVTSCFLNLTISAWFEKIGKKSYS